MITFMMRNISSAGRCDHRNETIRVLAESVPVRCDAIQ